VCARRTTRTSTPRRRHAIARSSPNGWWTCGPGRDAADVAAQVGRLADVRGLTRVIAFPQAPGVGFAAREEILKMFSEEVASRWHVA